MDEIKSLKALMFFVIVFIFATYQSCSELRLSAFGKVTEGKVKQVLAEVKGGTREETGRYKVEYYFLPANAINGQATFGSYFVNKQEAINRSDDNKVSIIYLADKPHVHRVKGHRGVIWIALFFVMLSIVTVNVVILIRQAQADVKRYGRR
jgi:hypothetical protein